MAAKIQLRRDTNANWATANPVLADGEFGYVTDSKDFKVGDGVTRWTALPAWSPNVIKGDSKLVVVTDMSYGTAQATYTASTAGTSELKYKIGVSAVNIAALFTHWYTTGTFPNADTDPSGPITFSASLRVVSSSNPDTVTNTIFRLTFNGRTSTTLDPGGRIVSDPLGLSLVPGDVVAIRTYLSAGTAYALRITSGAASRPNNGGFTATSDLTAPGSAAIGYSTGFYYGPAAILGCPDGSRTAKSVVLLGDSIAAGIGDSGCLYTNPGLGSGGFVLRALSGEAGLLNNAMPGESADGFLGTVGSFRRYGNVGYANSAIIEYGTNDLNSGTATATELQASLLTLATNIRRMGISKVFLTTLVPRATSTDAFATSTNQTPISTESERVAHNNWVRGGCPIDATTLAPVATGTSGALTAGESGHPVNGFFDTAAKVETAPNSGRWQAAQRVLSGASMTSGSNVVTCASGNFDSGPQESGGDLGTYVYVRGAGASGGDLLGVVISVTSPTKIIVNANAQTTVSNAQVNMGVATGEGVHPTSHGHYLMSQAIDPALL